jgi:hypothetical protein
MSARIPVESDALPMSVWLIPDQRLAAALRPRSCTIAVLAQVSWIVRAQACPVLECNVGVCSNLGALLLHRVQSFLKVNSCRLQRRHNQT